MEINRVKEEKSNERQQLRILKSAREKELEGQQQTESKGSKLKSQRPGRWVTDGAQERERDRKQSGNCPHRDDNVEHMCVHV